MPVVFVLLATGYRLPETTSFMRWIWASGKSLLITSYILGVCIFLLLNYPAIYNDYANSLSLAATIFVPDIVFVMMIIKSELMKDVFSEFPPSPIKK